MSIRPLVVAIGEKLGIKEGDYAAWTKVRVTEFKRHPAGRALMEQYQHSFITILKDAFPDHTWDISQLWKVPRNHWKSTTNQRSQVEAIGLELGIAVGNMERWYRIGNSEFIEKGGGPILKRHGWSMSSLLLELFPEHHWELERFAHKPQNYWKSTENIRTQIEVIRSKLALGESDLSAWYKISTKSFREVGGGSLLALHSFSLLKVLRAAYPEHTWDPNLFPKKPQRHWESADNRRELMLQIGAALGIKEGETEGWYKVSKADLFEHGAGSILVRYYSSSPSALIMSAFPEYSWNVARFKAPPQPDEPDDQLRSLIEPFRVIVK